MVGCSSQSNPVRGRQESVEHISVVLSNFRCKDEAVVNLRGNEGVRGSIRIRAHQDRIAVDSMTPLRAAQRVLTRTAPPGSRPLLPRSTRPADPKASNAAVRNHKQTSQSRAALGLVSSAAGLLRSYTGACSSWRASLTANSRQPYWNFNWPRERHRTLVDREVSRLASYWAGWTRVRRRRRRR